MRILLRRSSCFFLLFAPLVVGCGGAPPQGAREVEDSNEEVVRRFIGAINDRQLDALDELVQADMIRHSQATPGLQITSLEQLKAFLEADFEAIPDSRQVVHLLVAEGDYVAVWVTYSGTQEGPMGPFPATGKETSLDIAGFFRLADGKIAEIWVAWDNLTILTQLGHIPAGPGAEMFEAAPEAATPE